MRILLIDNFPHDKSGQLTQLEHEALIKSIASSILNKGIDIVVPLNSECDSLNRAIQAVIDSEKPDSERSIGTKKKGELRLIYGRKSGGVDSSYISELRSTSPSRVSLVAVPGGWPHAQVRAVHEAEVALLIGGSTERDAVHIRLCDAIDVPVLPLSFTGGLAEKRWTEDKSIQLPKPLRTLLERGRFASASRKAAAPNTVGSPGTEEGLRSFSENLISALTRQARGSTTIQTRLTHLGLSTLFAVGSIHSWLVLISSTSPSASSSFYIIVCATVLGAVLREAGDGYNYKDPQRAAIGLLEVLLFSIILGVGFYILLQSGSTLLRGRGQADTVVFANPMMVSLAGFATGFLKDIVESSLRKSFGSGIQSSDNT